MSNKKCVCLTYIENVIQTLYYVYVAQSPIYIINCFNQVKTKDRACSIYLSVFNFNQFKCKLTQFRECYN